ncbi:MAG: transketolase family protein [Dysgonamonadaceae bacterium]|jgi:transketolase|nr:transketolase family protein [Dysgonamonadaceae bacterium]
MMNQLEMRAVYTQTLIELAKKDERIVLLEADLMKASGTGIFKNIFPERTFNMGVAEANMVGVAAGLSAGGKIPFSDTFACFAARRAYDQFFISGNYARLNVKLVGTDPGIASEYNGGTHMPFEDIGIMRNIPKLVVFEPSDPVSLKKLVEKSASYQGCTYMRLHRKPITVIYSEEDEFELGKGKILKDGTDITLIASGAIMVAEALKASELLIEEGISAAVIDMHTIKPIDTELILHYARKTGGLVTCENHQQINGLGSAVAETLIENYPVLLNRIGVRDEFGEVGKTDYLLERYQLSAGHIVSAAKTNLEQRKKLELIQI